MSTLDQSFEAIFINMPNHIICDFCSKDYSESNEVGGILFGRKAACPDCSPRISNLAKIHGEENFIKKKAVNGQTFKEFVLDVRNSDNKCIECAEKFVLQKNIFTAAGQRESAISGLCEICFDKIFGE